MYIYVKNLPTHGHLNKITGWEKSVHFTGRPEGTHIELSQF